MVESDDELLDELMLRDRAEGDSGGIGSGRTTGLLLSLEDAERYAGGEDCPESRCRGPFAMTCSSVFLETTLGGRIVSDERDDDDDELKDEDDDEENLEDKDAAFFGEGCLAE